MSNLMFVELSTEEQQLLVGGDGQESSQQSQSDSKSDSKSKTEMDKEKISFLPLIVLVPLPTIDVPIK